MSPRSSARAARPVSYRESESDDDESVNDDSFSESEVEAPRLPRPRRPSRPKRKISEEAGPSYKKPSTRGVTRVASYAEDFSEDEQSDFFSDEVGEDAEVTTTAHRTKKQKVSPRKKSTASPRKRPQPRPRVARSPPRPTRKAAASTPKEIVPVVSDNRIPDWKSLPYSVLVDIMIYASHPLFDENNVPSSSIAWLLKTSLVCQAFCEPALEALYHCPPLLDAVRPHRLLPILAQDPASRAINYNVKTKRLELEVRSTLAYSAGSAYGAFDLGQLLQLLPQLNEIDIWSIYDSPRHRFSHTPKQWVYPESMFDALIAGGNKLKSFHWNGRLLGKIGDTPTSLYKRMSATHLAAPFQSLRNLTLTNFLGDSEERMLLAEPLLATTKPLSTTQLTKEEAREEKRQALKKEDSILAEAISDLPNLQLLDLHQCSIVDGEWLSWLPKTLTSLGITECERIESDGLQSFLESHGSLLTELSLNHNPALSISFLTTLKANCPRLEAFSMDLTYYSKHIATGAREPEYINLLLPDEVPTWPSTLQSIDMFHLRHWTSSAADTFFNSLVDSSGGLLDLRRLTLVVSIDIAWRDRATFRDQWIAKLNRIFLRKPTPPNPYWRSLRMMREWKVKQRSDIETQARSASPEHPATEDDSPPASQKQGNNETLKKKSLRPRRSSRRTEVAGMPSTASLKSPLAGTAADIVEEQHVQGMCDIVDIRIDNLRPRETQLNENDFLDSEVSGDDDWDESNGDLDPEVLYAKKKGKGRKNGYAW